MHADEPTLVFETRNSSHLIKAKSPRHPRFQTSSATDGELSRVSRVMHLQCHGSAATGNIRSHRSCKRFGRTWYYLHLSPAIRNTALMPGNIADSTPSRTWPEPNYDNPVTRGWLPAFAISIHVLASLLVAVRVGLRFNKKAGGFGVDDVSLFQGLFTIAMPG